MNKSQLSTILNLHLYILAKWMIVYFPFRSVQGVTEKVGDSLLISFLAHRAYLLQLPEMVHQLGEWGVTEMFFLPRVDFADLMNE